MYIFIRESLKDAGMKEDKVYLRAQIQQKQFCNLVWNEMTDIFN